MSDLGHNIDEPEDQPGGVLDPRTAGERPTRTTPRAPVSRRHFLHGVGGAAGASLLLSLAGSTSLTLLGTKRARAAEIGPLLGQERADQALRVRRDAAQFQRDQPLPDHPCNGDEDRYPDDRLGSYTKAFRHNGLGDVVPGDYLLYLQALRAGSFADFDRIPRGGSRKQVDPQASYAYELEGADPYALTMRPAPAFDSAEEAGEMVELYWQALTRDVHFDDYAANPVTREAAADLSRLSDFRGPKEGDGNQVTPQTLFRNLFVGDLEGPYVSQLLLLPIPYGALPIVQQIRTVVPGVDYLIPYDDWLAVHNGAAPGANTFDPVRRYIRNGRDLGEYVHRDFPQQSWINAALILLGLATGNPLGTPVVPLLFGTGLPIFAFPFDRANPYNNSFFQEGFATFGAPDIIDLVGDVPNAALKAAWYQKWLVHRRLRPEEFGGRVHNHLVGAAQYPIHPDLFNASVLPQVAAYNWAQTGEGTYLLGQAFPEGSPTHPAYPSGHATYAGAAVTVLKAFFDESRGFDLPVTASADGTSLVPIDVNLTIGGELNKLASNIAFGRNAAGVHWRTDAVEGLLLGEQVGIRYLQDLRRQYPEPFNGFTFTPFLGGDPVTI